MAKLKPMNPIRRQIELLREQKRIIARQFDDAIAALEAALPPRPRSGDKPFVVGGFRFDPNARRGSMVTRYPEGERK